MHRLAAVVVIATRVAYAQPEPEPPPTPEPPVEPQPAPPPPAPVASPSAPEPTAEPDRWSMRLGGYVQPQFRVRQNSPAADDENGFRFARARLTAAAEGRAGNLVLSAFIEAELQPEFTLADAFATVSRPLDDKGVVTVDVGQTRVPFSRQQLISDSRLSFVDKAQLASIAPDRDLGLRATVVPPGLPLLRVIAGAFNGEGRNVVKNINESFLFAGRIEVTPLGGPAPYAESAFASDPWVSIAISAAHNKVGPANDLDTQLSLGADLSGAYRGISGSVEYLLVKHTFSDPSKPAFDAVGWMAQLAYLLPFELPPYGQTRLEVAARVEEIDRNDTVPIPQLGDPAQSVREYTGVISAYVRQHLLKAQLAFSHFQEIETMTSTGQDATYPNDQVLFQLTYRVE